MHERNNKIRRLRKQNFRLAGLICLVGLVLVFLKTLLDSLLPEAAGITLLAVEQILLAWMVYQLGTYVRNFGKSTTRVFATVLVGVILFKLVYSLVLILEPKLQYQGLILLFNTLFISLYFIIGRQLYTIQNDFVGGLKYIGVLFIGKSIFIFLALLVSVAMTYLVTTVAGNSVVHILWLTSNFFTVFIDFAIYYILFKIFSNAYLMPSR